jgi:PAS domain S-box-containing protein
MRHLGESLDASRDSEQRYRLLADNVSDVVFMLSLDMQKTLFMSPSIELQRGYTPEEATAMSVVDSVSADTLPVVMGIYHQALDDMQTGTDRIYELEYELKHKDGHYIWNEGRITILRDADGAPSCFLGVNRNIADRKRAEAEHRELETQIRHIQRIESVGQLAGGIAHDFNNILVAITGYAELSLSNELGKEDRENLQGIIGSAERAAELTSRLLAFGSRQVVNLETVSLGDLVIGLEGMFNRLIREDIVLSIDVTDHALNVEADSGQLEQVLVNLVVNARDAMPTGGRLKILLDRAGADDAFLGQQSDLVGGDYASITVRDYGIGVPEDQDDRLFEPFFTTKPHGSGNGLGLSVVQGIVRQHQGHVTFNRRADGTDFVVYLPQSSQAATSPRAPAASGYSRQGSETILIAEDDEQVRIVVSKMLQQAGYRLIVAKDGLEALDLFERHEADIELILMDLVMPKLNGKDVLLKIRETNTTVPFLFSSGYFDGGEESDLFNDYDAELLQKPYVRNTLLETVRRMIDSVQPARRSAH